MREAGNINRTLSALNCCLRDLRKGGRASSFRADPVTHALSHVLRGWRPRTASNEGAQRDSPKEPSRVVMLVTAYPGKRDYDEKRQALLVSAAP